MTTPQRAKYLAGISEAERKVRANIKAEKAVIQTQRRRISEAEHDNRMIYKEYFDLEVLTSTEYVNIRHSNDIQILNAIDRIRSCKANIRVLKKQLSMSYYCQAIDYPSECFAIFYPQCGHEVWAIREHMGEIRYCPFCGRRIDIKRGKHL